MSQRYASQQGADYKNYIENIAIVGAGGNVGKYITKALVATGKHKVTAITRPDSTSSIPEGTIVKKVDYSGDDLSALVDALRGQDALIITMGVMAENDPQKKLIQAAIEAKVPWVVPNEFGPDGTEEKLGEDTLLGPRAKAYRQQIEQGGISWVEPACGFWYEYSLAGGAGRYGFDMDKKTVLFYDDGKKKINTSTWPQVGRGVAAFFSLKVLPEDANDDATKTISHYKNKYFHITSFRVSQQDMLDSVLRVTKTSRDDWTITSKPAKDVYEQSKQIVFSGDRRAFASMLYSRAFYNDGSMDWEAKIINDKLSLPKEDLDELTKSALEMKASWALGNYTS